MSQFTYHSMNDDDGSVSDYFTEEAAMKALYDGPLRYQWFRRHYAGPGGTLVTDEWTPSLSLEEWKKQKAAPRK